MPCRENGTQIKLNPKVNLIFSLSLRLAHLSYKTYMKTNKAENNHTYKIALRGPAMTTIFTFFKNELLLLFYQKQDNH